MVAIAAKTPMLTSGPQTNYWVQVLVLTVRAIENNTISALPKMNVAAWNKQFKQSIVWLTKQEKTDKNYGTKFIRN